MVAHLLFHQLSLRAVPAAYHVSEKTVRRRVQRAQETHFPSQLYDRSSIPHRQPRRTKSKLESHIVALRRQRRSYAQILTMVTVSKTTISRVLRPSLHS
jgi:hypothetical protein